MELHPSWLTPMPGPRSKPQPLTRDRLEQERRAEELGELIKEGKVD